MRFPQMNSMRISTFWYCLETGHHKYMQKYFVLLGFHGDYFCVYFLFCLFFAIDSQCAECGKTAETTTMGITVFLTRICRRIRSGSRVTSGLGRVREAEYISADQAWENFKTEYFKGMEELAEGFADDNPAGGLRVLYPFFERHCRTRIRWCPAGADRRRAQGELFQHRAVAGLQAPERSWDFCPR